MLTFLQAIKLFREFAAAIRAKDLPKIGELLSELAEAIGLDKELSQVKALFDAIQRRDFVVAIAALRDLLTLIADLLKTPRVVGAPVFSTTEAVAIALEDQAKHLEMHIGRRLEAGASADEKIVVGGVVGVSGSVILMLVEMVIAALSLWAASEKDTPAAISSPAPSHSATP